MKRRIIFLDIDGVLNGHEMNKESGSCSICTDKIRHFNTLLKGSGIEIVIASAWRYLVLSGSMRLDGFSNMMRTHGLRKSTKIVGILGPDQSEETSNRGLLIREFLDLERINGRWRDGVDLYVAIDDMDLGYSELETPFVRTNAKTGFEEKHISIVRGLLDL